MELGARVETMLKEKKVNMYGPTTCQKFLYIL